MNIKFQREENISGDPDLSNQGFGRITKDQPPKYDPKTELKNACGYFRKNGYTVLKHCLNNTEINHLNEFFDRTQIDHPESWGLGKHRKKQHLNQGIIFSLPLLDYSELDHYIQHPPSYPVVCRLLGGEENVRFNEFNFREIPNNVGYRSMNFHYDGVLPDRLKRNPYMPCDWIGVIHYLTDVDFKSPSLCVVPKSNLYDSLKSAYETLREEYMEVPIYGKKGTCILYDTALFHTRLDGDGIKSRRTWHQYYARGGWINSSLPNQNHYLRAPSPTLTNWNLFPERLVFHEDFKIRKFFSHWNASQCEWVISDFDKGYRNLTSRGIY